MEIMHVGPVVIEVLKVVLVVLSRVLVVLTVLFVVLDVVLVVPDVVLVSLDVMPVVLVIDIEVMCEVLVSFDVFTVTECSARGAGCSTHDDRSAGCSVRSSGCRRQKTLHVVLVVLIADVIVDFVVLVCLTQCS